MKNEVLCKKMFACSIAALLLFGCVTNNDPVREPGSAIALTITLPTQLLDNIAYDENYMQDCESRYPFEITEQAGVQGVYAGVTTKKELLVKLGQPDKSDILGDEEEYLYFDSESVNVYHFFIENNLVVNFHIESDTIIPSFPLKTILDTYGCPDFIYAFAPSDDLFDSSLVFSRTSLIYLDAGLRITFDSYPLTYENAPFVIGFLPPSSSKDFLEHEVASFNSKTSILVSFSESVK